MQKVTHMSPLTYSPQSPSVRVQISLTLDRLPRRWIKGRARTADADSPPSSPQAGVVAAAKHRVIPSAGSQVRKSSMFTKLFHGKAAGTKGL